MKFNVDLALFYSIESNKNMKYFSGYDGIGCLAIPKKKKPFLLVPEMEYLRAKKTKLKVYRWEKGKRLFKQLSEILKKEKIKPKTLGIVYRDFALDFFRSLRRNIKNVKVKDIQEDCLKIRAIKNNKEIMIIRKSCKIASDIMNSCIKNFKKFKTEEDVRKFLHLESVKLGCELAFPPIVATGSNGALPHYEPKNIKLKKGFCVIDFGVNYQGYHSDISRTIYLGTPNKEEIQAYDKVLKVQKDLIKSVKPNGKCSTLYNKALKELGERFNHGLGHGIGLNIHELPNLTLKSKDTFKNKMIFTIEPGLYFENRFGIRIEDDILLDKKPIILTTVPKNLITK